MRLFLLAVLALSGSAATRAEEPKPIYFALPVDLTWAELKPHVRSYVLPSGNDTTFRLFVCEKEAEGPTGHESPSRLADLMQIMIWNRLIVDEGFEDAIRTLGENFRGWYLKASPADRLGFKERFWTELESDDYIMGALFADLRAAAKTGCVRCLVCEEGAPLWPDGRLISCTGSVGG